MLIQCISYVQYYPSTSDVASMFNGTATTRLTASIPQKKIPSLILSNTANLSNPSPSPSRVPRFCRRPKSAGRREGQDPRHSPAAAPSPPLPCHSSAAAPSPPKARRPGSLPLPNGCPSPPAGFAAPPHTHRTMAVISGERSFLRSGSASLSIRGPPPARHPSCFINGEDGFNRPPRQQIVIHANDLSPAHNFIKRT